MTLAAGDGDIQVRPASETLIEAVPNQNVTTLIAMENGSGEDHECVSEVELPQGWRLITREFPFDLHHGERDLRLLSFFIPQGAPAGQYTVYYRVRSRKDPSVSGYFALPVHVREYREYLIEIWDAPRSVIAGEEIAVVLHVKNLSNLPDTLTIQGTTNQPWRVQTEPAAFRLEAGAMEEVTVRMKTDAGLAYTLSSHLRFSLHSGVLKKEVAGTGVSVGVISRVYGADDPYFRFPVTATAAVVTQTVDRKTASGFQGDVRGEGKLDQQGNHRLKFRLRGPDAYQKALSIYAERDEYMAEYSGNRLSAAAGDRYYTLSRLTQYSNYGRGVEAAFALNPNWKFGVYDQKNRWFSSKNRSTAGYVRYQATDLSIQAHLVDIERTRRSGTLFGFSGGGRWNNLLMNLEYAAEPEDGGIRSAVDAELSGKHERVAYHVRWIHADPEFAGYFSDTKYLSTALSVSPFRRAGIRLQYRYEKQNFELDTTRFDAPLARYFESGLYYQFSPRSQATIDYIRQSRKDRMNSFFDYDETSLRLRLNAPAGPATLSASAEFGETKNALYDRKAGKTRYTASVYYSPSSRQNYRGFVYWDENIRYSGEKRRVFTAGLQMRYHVGQRLQTMLSLQNNYSPEEYYEDRNQTEFLVRYLLPNRHTVQIRARHSLLRNSNRSDRAVVAEYQAPLGIPLSRKANTGIVRGRIFDAQNGQPLRNLLVRMNGFTAVTDEDGRFIFRNLQSREYYLSIDKAVMGLNRVTLVKTPMPVTPVEGKEGIFLELGVVDGAKLRGRVLLHSLPGDRGTDEEGFVIGAGEAAAADTATCENGSHGLPRIVVEMTREDEMIRRLTDANGDFAFEELRPGRWTVRFYRQNLPAYHQFEQDLFEIEIAAGESKQLNACVIPQRRRIRFMQEGGSVLYEKFKER
ncbi:MAG TPA: hypothetical protein ENN17_09400 [bacterium]|nr:hypothetical protein [bacterium]